MTFVDLPIGTLFQVADYNAPMYMWGRIYEKVAEARTDDEPVSARVMDGRIVKQNIGLWYNAVDQDPPSSRFVEVWINSAYKVAEVEYVQG